MNNPVTSILQNGFAESVESFEWTYQLQMNPVDHWASAEGKRADARYDDEAVK